MAKEKVKHLSGIFASVFAHYGHITKEEAKEISSLDDHEFDSLAMKFWEARSTMLGFVLQTTALVDYKECT